MNFSEGVNAVLKALISEPEDGIFSVREDIAVVNSELLSIVISERDGMPAQNESNGVIYV